jgi:hypothetical protein
MLCGLFKQFDLEADFVIFSPMKSIMFKVKRIRYWHAHFLSIPINELLLLLLLFMGILGQINVSFWLICYNLCTLLQATQWNHWRSVSLLAIAITWKNSKHQNSGGFTWDNPMSLAGFELTCEWRVVWNQRL